MSKFSKSNATIDTTKLKPTRGNWKVHNEINSLGSSIYGEMEMFCPMDLISKNWKGGIKVCLIQIWLAVPHRKGCRPWPLPQSPHQSELQYCRWSGTIGPHERHMRCNVQSPRCQQGRWGKKRQLGDRPPSSLMQFLLGLRDSPGTRGRKELTAFHSNCWEDVSLLTLGLQVLSTLSTITAHWDELNGSSY